MHLAARPRCVPTTSPRPSSCRAPGAGSMTPTPGAVPDLFPGAPQRVAGLDLHAIVGRPSTTLWLRSYPDVPPRARSAPRGAMTLALAPTLARHAEHASTAALDQPRHVYAAPVQPCALTMAAAPAFRFRFPGDPYSEQEWETGNPSIFVLTSPSISALMLTRRAASSSRAERARSSTRISHRTICTRRCWRLPDS